MKRFLFFLAAFMIFTACGTDDNKKSTTQNSSGCQVTPKEVLVGTVFNEMAPSQRFIVKLSPRVHGSATLKKRALAALPSQVAKDGIASDTYRLQYPNAITAREVARSFNAEDFAYIEPDYEVHTTLLSNDPSLDSQWAHEKVDSADAWDITRGSDKVIVAILDSGVDYSHPDLAGNMWTNSGEIAGNGIDDDGDGYVDDVYGWNFANDNSNPKADDSPSYHGTHVAGTVGAVGGNGVGISGHAQVVKLMALKFLGSNGSGYTSDAVRGIDYAIAHKANIISNSWGGGGYSQSLSDAIERARQAGILFIAAAGNAGINNDVSNFYPANYPQDNVISVAATTSSDALASFSDYGARKVHIGSPGVGIYSTLNGNSYGAKSGTSMATPLISGVLALMESLRPDLSYLQIKGALLGTVDEVPALRGKVASNGRVNAYRALSQVATLPGDWVPLPMPNCN